MSRKSMFSPRVHEPTLTTEILALAEIKVGPQFWIPYNSTCGTLLQGIGFIVTQSTTITTTHLTYYSACYPSL